MMLARFGVSIDDELIRRFDKLCKSRGMPTRSKAIGDLIRAELVREEWKCGRAVAGAITLVYDHHKRALINRLTDIQHQFHHLVLSSQHVHLDHHHCLEIVAVKGKAKEVSLLAERLQSTKGVAHCSLTMTTTGKGIG